MCFPVLSSRLCCGAKQPFSLKSYDWGAVAFDSISGVAALAIGGLILGGINLGVGTIGNQVSWFLLGGGISLLVIDGIILSVRLCNNKKAKSHEQPREDQGKGKVMEDLRKTLEKRRTQKKEKVPLERSENNVPSNPPQPTPKSSNAKERPAPREGCFKHLRDEQIETIAQSAFKKYAVQGQLDQQVKEAEKLAGFIMQELPERVRMIKGSLARDGKAWTGDGLDQKVEEKIFKWALKTQLLLSERQKNFYCSSRKGYNTLSYSQGDKRSPWAKLLGDYPLYERQSQDGSVHYYFIGKTLGQVLGLDLLEKKKIVDSETTQALF